VLVTDFDGVVVDGMAEYWWAARQCALQLDGSLAALPEAIPEDFRRLRPRVLSGWEMPVLAASIGGLGPGPGAFIADYPKALAAALAGLGWEAQGLTQLLDQVRQRALGADRQGWLDRHRPYPWMLGRLLQCQREGEPWRVLTTKSAAFTAELLRAHGLSPQAIHGREEGPKPAVLQRLLGGASGRGAGQRWWFLEDRRLTLEAVRSTPGLESVHCLLASWGYLLPEDSEHLPAGLHLLTPEQLATPLANWP